MYSLVDAVSKIKESGRPAKLEFRHGLLEEDHVADLVVERLNMEMLNFFHLSFGFFVEYLAVLALLFQEKLRFG